MPNIYKRGRSDYEAIRDLASDPEQQPAEVTEHELEDMRDCVPPIFLKHRIGFLVGEAITSDERGTVFAHYYNEAGKCFARYTVIQTKGNSL